MASTLKVNTIAHTGGTTAATIDGTGRILQPAKPAFRVAKTDSDQTVTSGQDTKVTFNNTIFDIGSDFGSNKFTAPVAGTYHFDAAVRVGPTVNNASFYNAQVFLKKNNNSHVMLQQIGTYANNLGGGTAHMSLCNLGGGVTTSLAAGDEIEVWVYLQGSSPIIHYTSNNFTYTYFSGFLIG